jgi:hypothetical protein
MLSSIATFTGTVLSGVADVVFRAVTGRKRGHEEGASGPGACDATMLV